MEKTLSCQLHVRRMWLPSKPHYKRSHLDSGDPVSSLRGQMPQWWKLPARRFDGSVAAPAWTSISGDGGGENAKKRTTLPLYRDLYGLYARGVENAEGTHAPRTYSSSIKVKYFPFCLHYKLHVKLLFLVLTEHMGAYWDLSCSQLVLTNHLAVIGK